MHSGGVHGGHYYAFIRPDGKEWFRFDDERVTKEDDKRAMDEQFGGLSNAALCLDAPLCCGEILFSMGDKLQYGQ